MTKSKAFCKLLPPKFFIYMSSLHVNEAIKKEVILNLNVSYVYCKSFIITTVYDIYDIWTIIRILTGIFRTFPFQPGTFGTFPRFSWTFPTKRGLFHNIRNFFKGDISSGDFFNTRWPFPTVVGSFRNARLRISMHVPYDRYFYEANDKGTRPSLWPPGRYCSC